MVILWGTLEIDGGETDVEADTEEVFRAVLYAVLDLQHFSQAPQLNMGRTKIADSSYQILHRVTGLRHT